LLIKYADKVDGVSGFDNRLGNGRLNVFNFIKNINN
jgi:hypothetical protein